MRPETFVTETRKNGPRDESRDPITGERTCPNKRDNSLSGWQSSTQPLDWEADRTPYHQ